MNYLKPVPEIRHTVMENVSQYERTLAYLHMKGEEALAPGQLQSDREIVAQGLELSGATRRKIEALLTCVEEYVQTDAELHRHLLTQGGRMKEMHATTAVKLDYARTRNLENAVQALSRIGYVTQDPSVLQTLLDAITEVDRRYHEAVDGATEEIIAHTLHSHSVDGREPVN